MDSGLSGAVVWATGALPAELCGRPTWKRLVTVRPLLQTLRAWCCAA